MLALLYAIFSLLLKMHVKAQRSVLDSPFGSYSPRISNMVSKDEPHIVFIAGYQDLTNQEFTEHYKGELDRTIAHSDSFLLSDEPGACTMAFEYLQSKHIDGSRILVYTSSDTGTPTNINTSQFQAVDGGDTERYIAMAYESNTNIIWIRPEDWPQLKCTHQTEILDKRFSGTKEAMRMVMAKSLRHSMWVYDQIV
jgi:hypothetical protein